MTTYVAFLRGINVGGHKPVKMDDLKAAFESLGFKNVKTLITSGNVLFDTSATDASALTQDIESGLKDTFGYEIGVVLRTIDDLKIMMASDPFQGIKEDSNTKLYVSFLREEPKSRLKIPYEPARKGLRIVKATKGEVFTVSFHLPNGHFGNPISLVEREFAKKSTTRNWNTIVKLVRDFLD